MSGFFRVLSKTVSTVLIVVVILLAILLAGVRLIGFTPYTVLSGSMEPAYHVGSVIYVTDVDPAELEVGDPITYKTSNGTVVTHRIVRVLNVGDPTALFFQTKGDANEDADGTPVPAAAIIGLPRFSIPYLGYLANFIKTRQGVIVIAAVCVLAIVVSALADVLFPKAPKEEDESTGA